MEKNKVASALQKLVASDETRSETARLRDIIDDVEAALTAGVNRMKVLEALHEQGFKMTLRAFDSALYRIRKQRAKQANPSPPAASPAPASGKEKPPATGATQAGEKEGVLKIGNFEVPKPKTFEHKPNADKDELL